MYKRAIIAALCLIAVLLSGCGKPDNTEFEETTEAGYRRTTLYYLSDDGYIVPVMKRIPWEEGIGRASLGYLVGSASNDTAAAEMGLNTVVPEGAELTLRIDDGKATVDIENLTALATSEQERAMVVSIVNTLAEFPSIDNVRMTIDGKNASSLPHGTDISKTMTASALNIESGSVPVSGDAEPITLYFPNSSASLNIPVTRYVSANPTLGIAVQELITGSKDARLLDCFPDGTELLSAYVSDGVAHIDLSHAFVETESADGLAEAALDSLYLTANGIEPVYAVEVCVEGEDYMRRDSSEAPIYVNEFR